MKKIREISLLTMMVSSGLVTNSATAEEAKSARGYEARVSELKAKTIALAKVPHGTVESSELERENGHLIWSFDISQPSVSGVTEVQVDAKSGEIVSVKIETPKQEASEAKSERPNGK